jgi:CHAT domain-containing protein/tetratricopeptide (TPR) repeat protein
MSHHQLSSGLSIILSLVGAVAVASVLVLPATVLLDAVCFWFARRPRRGGVRVQSLGGASIASMCFVAGCLAWPGDLNARHSDGLAALDRQIIELHDAGKYAEALPLAQRLVTLTKARYGIVSAEHADALKRVAQNYVFQYRYSEAEPIYTRVLAIRTKVLGADDESVLSTIVDLAVLYRVTGRPQMGESSLREGLAQRERAVGHNHPSLVDALRELAETERSSQHYSEAEADLHRALAISKKTKQDPKRVALLLGALSDVELSQRHLAEAERSLKEALALHEKALRTDPTPQLAHVLTLYQLMRLYQVSERYDDANLLGDRALGILEKIYGPDHPTVASHFEIVAAIYEGRGRYDEGDAMRKRALTIVERAYGKESIPFARSLKALGGVYGSQGRNEEALALLLRALGIAEKALGSESPELYPYFSDIGTRYLSQKRYSDAEPFLMRALAGLEKAHIVDPFVAGQQLSEILQNLAVCHAAKGRYAEARAFIDRAQGVSERVFGTDHSQFGNTLTSLGALLLLQGQTDEADRLLQRALPITEKAGRSASIFADTIAGLGFVHFQREDWAKAYAAMKSASEIYIAIDQRAAAGGATRANAAPAGQAIPHALLYLAQAFTAYRLAEKDATGAEALRDDAFQMAQRAQISQAAAALGQMAARFSSGTGTLAVLVRERQDLGVEWQALDARLTTALAALPAQRDEAKEQTIRQRLAGLAARLDALNARFTKELPEYAALANPQPLTIADVQRLLAPLEALVLIANFAHQSLVWVIVTDAVRWFWLPLGEEEFASEVSALRCGLDASLWIIADSYDKCVETVKKYQYDATFDGQFVKVLPFDLERAHGLYKALLAPVEDMIKEKHLLIVPSNSLSNLPFNVLVTESPKARIPDTPTGYRDASWLGARQPLTTLPSVASLELLRQFAKAGRGSKRYYLGIGNPLLDGPQRGEWRDYYARQAEIARSKSCLSPSGPAEFASIPRRRSVENFAELFRDTGVDIEQVRQQTPLPGTADELCEVGRRLGAPASDIILGQNATEGVLKDLSDKGSLADYAIVHFATHGALTGQLSGWSEPGLILTPPPKGTSDPRLLQRDDGYVTASEIATLKFNADWVVLSACHTGESGGKSAEALSGLARAFFYAGTRALLVSHWDVDSDVAVKLTTRAFTELASNPNMGRAEAFRVSMRELIERGKAYEAHPSEWGPFAVVGEGAAGR